MAFECGCSNMAHAIIPGICWSVVFVKHNSIPQQGMPTVAS